MKKLKEKIQKFKREDGGIGCCEVVIATVLLLFLLWIIYFIVDGYYSL